MIKADGVAKLNYALQKQRKFYGLGFGLPE